MPASVVQADVRELARLQRLLAAARVRTDESALNALKQLRDQPPEDR